MVNISDIQGAVSSELSGFDSYVSERFSSDESAMQEMLCEALSSRGKGVRPMLVFLVYRLCGGDSAGLERANVAAMMCEMIHLASLIHDDVIDESSVRRGRPTMNSRWQSKRAVLVGDYILAKNLSIGMGSGQFDLVAHIVEAIGLLCEGEVVQDDCVRRGVVSVSDYMRAIELKTASLLSVSASSGALAAGAALEDIGVMGEFGRLIGLGFQIQDDILDYIGDDALGKACGQDLRECKFTLPLLLALESCSDLTLRESIICKVRDGLPGISDFEEVLAFVQLYKGIELAKVVAGGYLSSASKLLNRFSGSKYNIALNNLTLYILERNK